MIGQFRQQSHERNDPSMMMGMNPMAGGGGGWSNRPPAGPMFSDNPPPANPLHISWQDGRWPANFINGSNVLEYFSNPYNPFYDRTCNNENIKMQRLPMDQIVKFTGIEYTVLHALEPLFVIRKQKRHNPSQVTPVSDYYIIGGTVYQAPDLCSVINSRLLTAMSFVRASFEEAQACSRYHPSKGYSWEFKGQAKKQVEKKEQTEIRTTAFQRTRVDSLLADLTKKFPPPTSEEENPKLPLNAPTAAAITHDEIKPESETSVQGEIVRVSKVPSMLSDGEPPTKKMKT